MDMKGSDKDLDHTCFSVTDYWANSWILKKPKLSELATDFNKEHWAARSTGILCPTEILAGSARLHSAPSSGDSLSPCVTLKHQLGNFIASKFSGFNNQTK